MNTRLSARDAFFGFFGSGAVATLLSALLYNAFVRHRSMWFSGVWEGRHGTLFRLSEHPLSFAGLEALNLIALLVVALGDLLCIAIAIAILWAAIYQAIRNRCKGSTQEH